MTSPNAAKARFDSAVKRRQKLSDEYAEILADLSSPHLQHWQRRELLKKRSRVVARLAILKRRLPELKAAASVRIDHL